MSSPSPPSKKTKVASPPLCPRAPSAEVSELYPGIQSITPLDPNKTTAIERQNVLILYTGGTMGMCPDETGCLSPKRGYLTNKIVRMEELQSPEMPRCHIKENETLIDSADMGHEGWTQIAEDILENYYDFDGFVVIMGTDTMAYAATSLSFMLENLGKTVVFTGSQIPFCEVYNDARRNLIASIIFAANSDFSEVCLFFNDKLLRGNRAKKMNAFGLDAFDSPNFPPLAKLGVNVETRRDLAIRAPSAAFKVFKKLEKSIVTIRLIPGFDDEPLLMMVTHSKDLRAVVLELYGAGNAAGKGTLMQVLAKCKEKGIYVVATTQCVMGSVLFGKYAVTNELVNLGVISAGDMTAEAVAAKLGYLIAKASPALSSAEPCL